MKSLFDFLHSSPHFQFLFPKRAPTFGGFSNRASVRRGVSTKCKKSRCRRLSRQWNYNGSWRSVRSRRK